MHLTIYQPGIRYSLTVDMPRMILRWFVNPKSLLQCQHLRAEIDPSQCIGTVCNPLELYLTLTLKIVRLG